jgi:hypothetical protein
MENTWKEKLAWTMEGEHTWEQRRRTMVFLIWVIEKIKISWRESELTKESQFGEAQA